MSEFERRQRGSVATPATAPLQRRQDQVLFEPQRLPFRLVPVPAIRSLTPDLARSPIRAQRRAVSPTLQAAALSREDGLAVQRSADRVAVQRQAVEQSGTALQQRGLAPQPLHQLERQTPPTAAVPAPLSSIDRQERSRAAQQDVVALLNRDARALPFHKRAELVNHSIETARAQGLETDALRQHAFAAVSDPIQRDTLEGLFLRQDTGRLTASQKREDHALLVNHAQLQRVAEQGQSEHDALSEQNALERIQDRRGQGSPLPEEVREQLELGLNHDLSAVRVHTDDEADRIARSLHAVAFTSGKDIYFQAGEYNPVDKLELLAHEVTHVKQQDRGQVSLGIDPDAGLESEAQKFGEGFVLGGASTLSPKVRQGKKQVAGTNTPTTEAPRLAVQRRAPTPVPRVTPTETPAVGRTSSARTPAVPGRTTAGQPANRPGTATIPGHSAAPGKALGSGTPTLGQRVGAALNFDLGGWAVQQIDGGGARWATAHGNAQLAQFFQNDLQVSNHLMKVGTGPALLEAARAVPGQLQNTAGHYTAGSVSAGVGNLVGLGDVKGLITGTDFRSQEVNPYQAVFNLGLTAATGGAGRGAAAAGRGAQGALTRAAEDLAAQTRYNAALLAWKTGLCDRQVALPGAGVARLRPAPPRRADFAPRNEMTAASTNAPAAPAPRVPALVRQVGLAQQLPGWKTVKDFVGKPAGPMTVPPNYLYARVPLSSGKFAEYAYLPRDAGGAVPRLKKAPDGTWQPDGLKLDSKGRVVGDYRLAQSGEYNRTNPPPRIAGQSGLTQNHHMTADNVMRGSPVFQEVFRRGLSGPDRATNMINLATTEPNREVLRGAGHPMTDPTHYTQHPKADARVSDALRDQVETAQQSGRLPKNLKNATDQQLRDFVDLWDRFLRDRFEQTPDWFPRRPDGSLASLRTPLGQEASA